MKMAEAGMGRRLTLRGALLAGQVAVATVLLVAALLFTRSLVRAAGVDPGFDVDRLVVAQVSFVEGRQGEPAHPSIERIVDRVRAIPGVAAAAFSGGVPLTPISGSTRGTEVRIEGRTELIRVEYDGNGVGPGYFEAMGIRVLRGRPFGPADRAGAAAVVVINESFARRYFPGEDPIGQRWSDPDRAGSTVEIVGVVADSKYRTLAETGRPAMYEPALASRTPARTSNLIVRSAGSPGALGPEIRRAVLGEDDSASVVITPMRDAIAFAVLPSRMGSIFLGVMGTLGVALAMVGLLGVVSFAVSRRTPEIALRMALGASRTSVVKLVVLGAGSLVLTGLALGLVLAWLITAPLAAFLVAGLSATDPVTFGAAAILLLAVSLAAVWGPVRRATNIAPAIALKAE